MPHFCKSALWDWNLTWHTTNPFFTPCFEDVAIAPSPVAFLIFSSLLVNLRNFASSGTATPLRKISFRNLSLHFVLKTFIGISLIGIYILEAVRTSIEAEFEWVQILSPVILIFGYIGALAVSYLNYRSEVNNSGMEFGFWLLGTLSQGILFRTAYTKINGAKNAFFLVPRLITFPLVLLRFFLEFIPVNHHVKSSQELKAQSLPNPQKTSTFLSNLLFVWCDKLMWAGYRRTLTSDDLWDLETKDMSAAQFDALSHNMRNGSAGRHNLLVAILKTYGPIYLLPICLKIGGTALILVQPFIVRLLIQHIASEDEECWKGYLYLVIVVTSVLLNSISNLHSDKMTMVICMRIKSALSNAVFRKALRISHAAKTKQSSVGTMMNLISVDVQKFMDFIYVHFGMPGILVISVCTRILYNTLGVAAFVGLGSLGVLMLISNVLTGKFGAKLQRQGMKFRDDRMRITSEVLGGIKVLKFYGWERPFEKKISDVRNKELRCVWEVSWILSLASYLYVAAPILVAMTTISYHLLSNPENILTPTKVFVLINIMNILKGYVVILPVAFNHIAQLLVSIKRLNEFFQLEELEHRPDPQNHEYAVQIQSASFSWTSEKNILEKICLTVKEGNLVGVVGRIGSGKSSLLAAILGEIKLTDGSIEAIQSVAFVAQTPWIQNASLRDNILFGSPFDPHRYEAVINACALAEDIRLLPAGDQTEIGEHGTNLSGGQKQRVSLARAAYSDALFYLLDDPLSAVDANVGRHIFDSLLGKEGLLNTKTRLMVTHNINLLPSTDNIFIMKDGRVTESGSYHELLSSRGEFSEYLTHVHNNSVTNDQTTANEEVTIKDRNILAAATSSGGSQIVAKETAALGTVKFKYYYKYFSSAGFPFLFLTVLFFAVSEGMAGFNNMYLSNWTSSDLETRNSSQVNIRLTKYIFLGCGQTVATFLAFVFLTIVSVVATTKLHAGALHRILRCPMSYFDTTLKGTLISRFSLDVEVTDFPILHQLRLVSVVCVGVVVTVIIICITTPLFLIALAPISLIYVLLQRFYVATSRQLKRIVSISRSPILSHFSETLAGANTIRAFATQKSFISKCEQRIDDNQKSFFASTISTAWVNLRLEFLGALVVFFTTLFVLLGRGYVDPGSAGLAFTYALSITIHLNMLARLSSDLENNLVSVERLSELTETPQERDWEKTECKPGESWPAAGKITFEDYSSRYRDGLELVLKGITCEISPGEKIGIVGRTGAGKSSLAMALFRIIESAEGKIIIDDIDISSLGLCDLRRKMTIIPQEPLLFSGSLRENLDPFGEHTDDAQWQCLELAHLKGKFGTCDSGLDFKIEEDGKNLSIGERQLICLARALLRRSQILVLDEATAAIDLETDELVQKTIRQEFSKSTVLTVAHRLNTVLDSDRILVLSGGKVLEFDAPSNLLNKSNSAFSEMLRNTKTIQT